jgi:hypothetical protein
MIDCLFYTMAAVLNGWPPFLLWQLQIRAFYPIQKNAGSILAKGTGTRILQIKRILTDTAINTEENGFRNACGIFKYLLVKVSTDKPSTHNRQSTTATRNPQLQTDNPQLTTNNRQS